VDLVGDLQSSMCIPVV